MGKNQTYKAMQRARLGSSSAGPEQIEDGMMDGSFHSPEWHAARLASLKTSHTVTWEEFKKKQKVMNALDTEHMEDELRKGELEADKDKMMREYRAQLDAERERKLARGRNHSSYKSNHKEKTDRELKKSSSKKRKRSKRISESSSSSSSSESSSSDESERESRRSKSRSKKAKKKREHKSRRHGHSSSDSEGDGPLPLSRFFGSAKS